MTSLYSFIFSTHTYSITTTITFYMLATFTTVYHPYYYTMTSGKTRYIRIIICYDQLRPSPSTAPEVFACACDFAAGYSYPIDWWSLGVTAYEVRRKARELLTLALKAPQPLQEPY